MFLKIDLPDELLKRLKSAAIGQGYDLNQCVVSVLEHAAQSYEDANALLKEYIKSHMGRAMKKSSQSSRSHKK